MVRAPTARPPRDWAPRVAQATRISDTLGPLIFGPIFFAPPPRRPAGGLQEEAEGEKAEGGRKLEQYAI